MAAASLCSHSLVGLRVDNLFRTEELNRRTPVPCVDLEVFAAVRYQNKGHLLQP